ncbi:phosphotransferase family protein [Myceligenerans xiligouense]|uniref:Aminoglycoside phosphotransferase (APT) family kinase protein n=1 Tax=Myceligenerans xiligouense TaxID=253184 RepID=A0A3N4Z349_9MICO|nr:phosphotransferase family protein [Myceligenerans xiligouense]RPF20408.1 aminoglycoside phosphotransferase (APT) family kinase protein [Myceligenerans xiligouense]
MTEVPGLDQAGLTRWLEREHPELAAGPLTATLIPGGRSNLTYRVDGARVPLVVRRPPLGHVLSSAHDMGREHRVISALRDSSVPVPGAVDVVDDTAADEVTGTVFFVMEHVAGTVLSRPELNAGWTPDGLRALSLHLAEVLADLHTLDPASVGLTGFGRPDGYLERQLRTWRRQYDASRSRELPALDRLQDHLGDRLPEQNPRAAVVHGDYRLDNVIVAAPPATPRVAAVIDWEMATLGDPLVDLGMLAMYWEIAGLTGGDGPAVSAVVPGAGYPGLDELVDAYAARARITTPDLSWYRAFATYKLAVILEGIHFRFRAGETVGAGFDAIGDLVLPLAEDGLARIATRRS